MTLRMPCVITCAFAALSLAPGARAQGQPNQDPPQGVSALVFHLNDTGVVVTRQLRVRSGFDVELDGVTVGGVHRVDGLEHARTSAHATETIEILFERLEIK